MARNQIVCFEGDMGSGKTLLMTIFILKSCIFSSYIEKKINIFSNYHLDFNLKNITIEYLDQLELRDFFKKDGLAFQCRDYILAIDEIVTFADSYKWMNDDINRFCKYALQSRKRNVKIFYSAQFVSQAPTRLRKITNIIIKPKIDELNDTLQYDVFSFDGLHRRYITTKKIIDIHKYFDFYDTDEVIEIID